MGISTDWSIKFIRQSPQHIAGVSDPRAICPHCRNASTFLIRANHFVNGGLTSEVYLILECNYARCHGIVFIQTSLKHGQTDLAANDPFFVYPSLAIDPAHPSVPPYIADDWIEAQKSLEAGAPKAAAVMFRRVLYGILLDKGCTLHPLHKGLAELISGQRLPAIFDEWLPAIKDDGHDGAHPDRALQIDPQNVLDTKEYTSELLRFLYIEPYEFQKRKARSATPAP